MNNRVIRVENLSKLYRLGELAPYHRFTELLSNLAAAPFHRLRRLLQAPGIVGATRPDHIWALRQVSFDVHQGEVIGIIGRNGAGKSTLLKILSRITHLTEGRVEIRGRIGSLLEVGTGFHPELTGRENIFLNGAILGMRRAEIKRKFDEIVAFAEVGQFLDTPVKRYSSGMHMRLAFAVAAHLEPEILLVDEVLAVGDATFQKKCLGKMQDVAQGGRTVLFVSHQMNSVRRLCQRCVLLDGGKICRIGSAAEVITAYESRLLDAEHPAVRPADAGPANFLNWEIVEPATDKSNWVDGLGPVKWRVKLQVNRPVAHGVHGVALRDSEGRIVWGWAAYGLRLEPGLREFEYQVPTLPLRPGVYSWTLSLYDGDRQLDVWQGVPQLMVVTPPLTHPSDEWAGWLNVPCTFVAR